MVRGQSPAPRRNPDQLESSKRPFPQSGGQTSGLRVGVGIARFAFLHRSVSPGESGLRRAPGALESRRIRSDRFLAVLPSGEPFERRRQEFFAPME